MSRKNEYGLSDDEIRYARSAAVPEVIRDQLARHHDSVGVETSFYRKAAARFSAEADAILEAVRLEHARGNLADAAEFKAALEREKRRAESLEVANREKDEHILRLTAGSAQAVHSGSD